MALLGFRQIVPAVILMLLASSSLAWSDELEQLDLAELRDAYTFDLHVARGLLEEDCRYGKIRGQAVSQKQLDNYLKVFLPEIKLYPPKLVEKAKVRRIVLCCDLHFAGQKRSAIPSWENETMYYDVVSWATTSYKQLVIHHELFHMIDVHDDGRIYQDDAWARLLPDSFQYGTGGRNAQGDRTMSHLTDKVAGFLSKYATTGIEEDKAETFAHMLLHPRYLDQRAETEALLAAKMFYMRRLLKQFCDDMDNDFWTHVKSIPRPDDTKLRSPS